jgi:transglutaminase-like putative cysteine protease
MGALGTLAAVLGIVDTLASAVQHGRKRARAKQLATAPRKADGPARATYHTVRSIDDRIKYIRQLVKEGGTHPKVRALAHSILNRKCDGEWCVPEKDQIAEVAALFREVRQRVRYTLDPVRADTYTAPQRTLFELSGGDCDDSAAALGALLESVGYEVKLRVVQTQGYDSWNHIYLITKLPYSSKWVPLDPSQDKPAGWEVPASLVTRKRDFEV